MPELALPRLDLTVRVGSTWPTRSRHATLLLNAQPHRNAAHQVLSEALNLGTDQPSSSIRMGMVTRVYRLDLHRGTHVLHHDALWRSLRCPTTPDSTTPRPRRSDAAKRPAALYAASRYCDSDRLTTLPGNNSAKLSTGCLASRRSVLGCIAILNTNTCRAAPSCRPGTSCSAARRLPRLRASAVALNRTFNLPRAMSPAFAGRWLSRSQGHMDFHAMARSTSEIIGTRLTRAFMCTHCRIKVANGLDAVDGAFSHLWRRHAQLLRIWAYQVARGDVRVGDPIDLSRRLDNRWQITTDRRKATGAASAGGGSMAPAGKVIRSSQVGRQLLHREPQYAAAIEGGPDRSARSSGEASRNSSRVPGYALAHATLSPEPSPGRPASLNATPGSARGARNDVSHRLVSCHQDHRMLGVWDGQRTELHVGSPSGA